MGKLRDRVVVITGASSGFGKGVAEKFASKGAHVVLGARRKAALDELSENCRRRGVRTVALGIDVSEAGQVEELAREAVREFGRIDVWINNAGVATYGRFEETPILEHEQVIKTNLLGYIYGSHAALRQFRLQGQGTLINVGSFAGVVAGPYFSSYCASKFGVRGLGMSLRQELHAEGISSIHVSTVMPTSMDTPFFEHAANHMGKPVRPMPPVYDPQQVIAAIYGVALQPKDEVIVGRRGRLGRAISRIAPKAMERQMANRAYQAHMSQSGYAPDSSGNLFEPVHSGADVRGGWRKHSLGTTILKTALGLTAVAGAAIGLLARTEIRQREKKAA